MRQQLKFGAEASRPPVPGLSQVCAFTNLIYSSRITKRRSLITALLIDTPTIRNRSNSFPMSAKHISNRHSLRPVLCHIFALVLLLGLGCAVMPVEAQQIAPKQLTVERIYSAPSLSGYQVNGIEWSPDGKRISYF